MVMTHETIRTAEEPIPVHPLGTRATVLLTSVFGPYARDDEYGSRTLNPMELYQNQVTRAEGPFSLRMFHRSWGIMLVQANISAPCALLDFPTKERFLAELRAHPYDVVGITAILPNLGKVQAMCRMIREHLPQATIVIGGHIANKPGLAQLVDADHIVRGEGVRWFRRFLGEEPGGPIRHPLTLSAFGTRTMGLTVRKQRGEVAATLIPSVGCPMGCNFCATSAMFGGKGKFVNFYETGDELFRVMCGLEQTLGVRSFFVMDENFLLHRRRALRVLELMQAQGKSWSLYVFSSARVVQSYTMEQLVGLETHTPENLDEAIEYSISHASDFHQFMLYTPISGTALYAEHLAKGTLLDHAEYEEGDIHGQFMFNYRHPHIPKGQEGAWLLKAFTRDFEVNGPSVLRIARTLLQGWQRYRRHPDLRIRRRFAWEARELVVTYPATLWAARQWFWTRHPALAQTLWALLDEIQTDVGWRARVAAELGGRVVFKKLCREAERLAAGWTYEPPTFYEANAPMLAALSNGSSGPAPIGWVTA